MKPFQFSDLRYAAFPLALLRTWILRKTYYPKISTVPVFWISRCKWAAPQSRLTGVVVVFQLVLETNQFGSVCLLVSRLSGRLSAESSSLRHAETSVSVGKSWFE